MIIDSDFKDVFAEIFSNLAADWNGIDVVISRELSIIIASWVGYAMNFYFMLHNNYVSIRVHS